MSVAHEARFLRDAARACLNDAYWTPQHHFTGHPRSLMVSIDRLLPRLARAIAQAEGAGLPAASMAELRSLAAELAGWRERLVAEYRLT